LTADHPGVPNSQLVEEQSPDAEKYKNKSIAEQNSVDQCWNMLMKPRYSALRKTIYTTNAGLCRFRSLVVNVSQSCRSNFNTPLRRRTVLQQTLYSHYRLTFLVQSLFLQRTFVILILSNSATTAGTRLSTRMEKAVQLRVVIVKIRKPQMTARQPSLLST